MHRKSHSKRNRREKVWNINKLIVKNDGRKMREKSAAPRLKNKKFLSLAEIMVDLISSYTSFRAAARVVDGRIACRSKYVRALNETTCGNCQRNARKQAAWTFFFKCLRMIQSRKWFMLASWYEPMHGYGKWFAWWQWYESHKLQHHASNLHINRWKWIKWYVCVFFLFHIVQKYLLHLS